MSDDDGFFARWSRRKAQGRSAVAGEVADGPHAASNADLRNMAPSPPPTPLSVPATPASPTDAQPPELPPPTMDDVAHLTPLSDYSRFVGAGVDEGVKRAALKRLFSDPHYNVMDGLDIYIGDYNTPDPIPDAMLRRLRQSKAMGLFEATDAASDAASSNELAAATAANAGETSPEASPDGASAPALSQSTSAETGHLSSEPRPDEDIAMRLQPDDAADAAGAGPHRPGPRT